MRKALAVITFITATVFYYRPDLISGVPFVYLYPLHLVIFVLAFMSVNKAFKNSEQIRTHFEVKSLQNNNKANKPLGYAWYLAFLLSQLAIMGGILLLFRKAGILFFPSEVSNIVAVFPGAWVSFSSLALVQLLFITTGIEQWVTAKRHANARKYDD